MIVNLSILKAEEFLDAHKRHYKVPGALPIFAIGLKGEELHGAVIVGKSMSSEDACLCHIYCDGVSEGYTMLYGAAWRAAKALGYTRMIL